MKEREQTIRNLNTRVSTLQAEVAELKRRGNMYQGGGGHGRGAGRGRRAGRVAVATAEVPARFLPPKRARIVEDPDYVQDRLGVCRE